MGTAMEAVVCAPPGFGLGVGTAKVVEGVGEVGSGVGVVIPA